MFSLVRTSRATLHFVLSSAVVFTWSASSSPVAAQTPPELLPYTAKLLAGGGSTAATKGAACSRPGATPSGNTSTDTYGDGCLATEIQLSSPRDAVVDKTGAVFFSDNINALIRRVDPITGIVTAVAGGAASNASGTVASPVTCGGTDPNSSTDVFGDGCLGTSVKLGHPAFLVFSTAGDLYFSDPYNYNVRKIAATNGVITGTGVITSVVGDQGGSSTTADGYRVPCSVTDTSSTTGCLLHSPYGLAFDSQGDLLIAEEYDEALLAVNTNPTGTTVVAGQSVPAGTLVKIAGSGASGAACVMGPSSTKNDGCTFGTYTTATAANTSELDAPYGVAIDGAGNIYFTDEYYYNVAVINSAGILSTYAGAYPLVHTVGKEAVTQRAKAGFAIGIDYGVAADLTGNIYVPDDTNGYIWRVDAASDSMYVVAGNGATATASPTTVGSPCPGNAAFTATDNAGDGCPALSAMFGGTGVFGVSADTNGNLFAADQSNNLIREFASGTQFGNVGASQTDYIDVHFAAGDGPTSAGAFTITLGQTIFTIGTPTYTVNSDNTTDYIVPITASPTVTGAFSGTLTVKSNQVPAGTPFGLTGNFAQSPVTRTVVSTSSAVNCTGNTNTYATTTSVTLTASLIANGPSAPTGTFTFFSNGTQIGTPQTVTNLGTASAPIYGATLAYTFATAGTYSITSTFTPTTGTYFATSTSTPVAIVSTTPAFGAATTSFQENTVTAGGTALYSFTLSQNVYTGTITFACSGLPAYSSCVFNPQTITATGCSTSNTIAMSITTQQPIASTPASVIPGGRWTVLSTLAAFGMLLLVGMRRRGAALRFGRLGMMLTLLLAASSIVACGSGSRATPGTPTSPLNNPYMITVTATGSTGAASSFVVQLAVK